MSEDDVIKRRRVPRREYKSKIGLLYRGTYEITQAHEIGERGMLINSSRKLSIEDMVVLTFTISGMDQAVVRGVVRYELKSEDANTTTRYGIEFIDVNFEVKRQIRFYVASTQRVDKLSKAS